MKDRSPLYPCNPSEHRRKLPSHVWAQGCPRSSKVGGKRADAEEMYQKLSTAWGTAARLIRASVFTHTDSCRYPRHQPGASALGRLVLTLQLLDVARGVRITGRNACQLLGVFKGRGSLSNIAAEADERQQRLAIVRVPRQVSFEHGQRLPLLAC